VAGHHDPVADVHAADRDRLKDALETGHPLQPPSARP
jgi:hypothetical protein